MHQVELVMRPNQTPVSWKDFCNCEPPNSMAIDGYVKCAPKLDRKGPWGNLDHHKGVIRLYTRATIAQAQIAIMQGLYEVFTRNGEILIFVCTNHPDEDSCGAYTVLKHGHQKSFLFSEKLMLFVYYADILDTTGGANPFPVNDVSTRKTLMEIAWVFEPYAQARVCGILDKKPKDPVECANIVYAVEKRILMYVAGKSKTIHFDTRYETVHAGLNWVVAKDVGLHTKMGLLADDYKIYAIFRERPDGRYNWRVGRMAISLLNLKLFAKRMNTQVDDIVDPKDLWGGSDTIIGSPQINGSIIRPDEMVCFLRESVIEGRKNYKRI